ncbi:MAG: DNA internalization-related competence protein ComEC/Rec2 [Anaerosomatales bacterium]|nr:DNA internalization-related competence protein ComEC/Rec2 [Anaerosomatales bacterium]
MKRPFVPPSAALLVGVWIGIVAAESAWWNGRFFTAAVGAVFAAVGGAAMAGSARCGVCRRWVVLLVVGVALGCLACAVWLRGFERRSELIADAGARTWDAVVIADGAEGRFGERTVVRVLEGPLEGCVLRVGLPEGRTAPELGRRVRFRAIVKRASETERARGDARQGVVGHATPWRFEEVGWTEGLLGAVYRWRARCGRDLAHIEGDPGALLAGIGLGDRRRVHGSDVEADFRTLGLSHALAVSGTHLGIVCGLMLTAARSVVRNRRMLQGIAVVTAWVFAAMTGFPISAVRACAMLSVLAVSRLAAVRSDALASLSCGAVAVLIAQPRAAFDVGFALSVSAVSGLLVFGPLVRAWIGAAVPELPRAAQEILAAAIAAQVSTTPVSSAAFGSVSVAAPIANAFVLPLIEPALGLVLGAACLGGWSSVLGRTWMFAAGVLARGATTIAQHLARVPGACIAVPARGACVVAVTALLGAWVLWPQPTQKSARRALVAAAALTTVVAFAQLPTAGVRVVVLDVGQGDAILVQSGWRTLLVDTGPNPATLRKALGRRGVRRIDALVLTHAHDDHTGGLAGLRGVYRPRWIGIPGVDGAEREMRSSVEQVLGPEGGSRVCGLRQGQRFAVSRATVEVLWPPKGLSRAAANDTSVVLHVSYGEFDAVLTGDAESPALDELARTRRLSPVEVLKVPHHGSDNGLDEVGMQGWRPHVAVISVGAGNDFGHPSTPVLEMLRSSGCRVYRTDLDGDVVIDVKRSRWRVRGTRRRSGRAAITPKAGGAASELCVTIARKVTTGREVAYGGHEGRRSQASLSHPRQGRVLAAGRGPPAACHVRSGRSLAD